MHAKSFSFTEYREVVKGNFELLENTQEGWHFRCPVCRTKEKHIARTISSCQSHNVSS